eukprot:TRINITY_DN2815_c0_g4_i5.p1 TRINITY_DN2815_c0_g4~~TRINITY_DN2815_c0_g4_i5.p1  ORF type:complete len:152 (+),score=29.08 TRINITY_DN2815_c0_g4_i5:102-557(+)
METEDQAAVKMQSMFRGHAARKRADVIKHDTARKKVQQYLQRNNIHGLLQHLMCLLTHIRPEDPKVFLLQEIERLANKQETDLVLEEDLDTMYDMVDITRQGYVTGVQLKHASVNLSAEVATKIEANRKYDRKEFKETLGRGLQTVNTWVK